MSPRVVLADGPLVEGELKFNREVTEPTEVLISVKWEDDEETAEATGFHYPRRDEQFHIHLWFQIWSY